MKVQTSSISVPLQPQTQSSRQTAQAATPSIGEQMQTALFGQPKPRPLDPAMFPHLAETMAYLDKTRRKLAAMQDEDEDFYSLQLAEGTIACIDEHGTIFVGKGFLELFGDMPEVIAGVLGHEIGHRPNHWKKNKRRHKMSLEELSAACRAAETEADAFAGRALAELGMSAEPLCAFLEAIDEGPHPAYWPVPDRIQVIQEAREGHLAKMRVRKSNHPEMDRMKAPKGHIGDA